MSIYLMIAIAVIGLLVLGTLKNQKGHKDHGTPSYKKRDLMTPTESSFFQELEGALPGYKVFPQIALSRVIEPKRNRNEREYMTDFRRISQKSLDFVICNANLCVIAIIELDDNSHQRENRKKADNDKDASLESAGMPIIRWTVKNRPKRNEIAEAIQNLK